jgi:hypothetical protein
LPSTGALPLSPEIMWTSASAPVMKVRFPRASSIAVLFFNIPL